MYQEELRADDVAQVPPVGPDDIHPYCCIHQLNTIFRKSPPAGADGHRASGRPGWAGVSVVGCKSRRHAGGHRVALKTRTILDVLKEIVCCHSFTGNDIITAAADRKT